MNALNHVSTMSCSLSPYTLDFFYYLPFVPSSKLIRSQFSKDVFSVKDRTDHNNLYLLELSQPGSLVGGLCTYIEAASMLPLFIIRVSTNTWGSLVSWRLFRPW